MKLRFFKKKRKLRVTITKDEILDQVIKLNWMLDEKIKTAGEDPKGAAGSSHLFNNHKRYKHEVQSNKVRLSN
jgi:hypothetical protein